MTTQTPETSMRDHDREELRHDCLRLAISANVGDPVEAARRFEAYILGHDAMTPRQLIDAALEAADVR